MDKLRPVLYVAALLAGAALWNSYCDNPQVARTALQVQQDHRDDSVHRANEVWKAQFLARDTARDDSLKILARGIRWARGEIAVLKARTIVPDSSAGREVLITQLAIKDSILAQQDTVIAALDSSVTLYQAMIFDRDTLIARRESETRALTLARDNWKRAAQPSLFVKLGRGLPYIAAGVVLGAVLTR